MSHEIESSEHYHYALEDGLPWHGLGIQRRGRMTLDDVVAALPRMAETPVLRPLYYHAKPGELADCGKRRAIVYPSDGQLIGIATTGYQPRSFVEAFRTAFGWLEALGATVSGAALLRGGSRAFILARVPSLGFTVAGDDRHAFWLSVFAGSDGVTGIYPHGTIVREVCANTVAAGLDDAKGRGAFYSVAHHGNVDAKLAEAGAALAKLAEVRDAYQRACDTLTARKLADAALGDFLGELSPGDTGRAKNVREGIRYLTLHGKGNAPYRGTAYAAFQGVTDFVDHAAVKTSAGDVNERRFLYATEGAGAQLKGRALQLLLAA